MIFGPEGLALLWGGLVYATGDEHWMLILELFWPGGLSLWSRWRLRIFRCVHLKLCEASLSLLLLFFGEKFGLLFGRSRLQLLLRYELEASRMLEPDWFEPSIACDFVLLVKLQCPRACQELLRC